MVIVTHTVTWEEFTPPPEWAQMTGLERMKSALATKAPRSPIAALMDIGTHEVAEGYARLDGRPGPQHTNPVGGVHGSFAAAVLDSACWMAAMTAMGVGEIPTTLELKISYTRPISIKAGVVNCEGKLIHRGGRTAITEARLIDSEGKLLAHATSTLMVLKP